jgi:hypothetical protein
MCAQLFSLKLSNDARFVLPATTTPKPRQAEKGEKFAFHYVLSFRARSVWRLFIRFAILLPALLLFAASLLLLSNVQQVISKRYSHFHFPIRLFVFLVLSSFRIPRRPRPSTTNDFVLDQKLLSTI